MGEKNEGKLEKGKKERGKKDRKERKKHIMEEGMKMGDEDRMKERRWKCNQKLDGRLGV